MAARESRHGDTCDSEKFAILRGHPGLGTEDGINHEVADQISKSFYPPRMISRRALGAVATHFGGNVTPAPI